MLNLIQRTEETRERIEVNCQNGANLVGRFFDSSSDKGILMFPGISEHKASLYHIAERLNQTGFKVFAFDLNSQGESSGDWDIEQIQESVHYIQDNIKKRYGLKRIGGFGNSAGGIGVGIASSRKDTDLECLCLTGTPSSIDKVVPRAVLQIAKYVPQFLVKVAAIGFDKVQANLLKNRNYLRLSHDEFKTSQGYQPYAMFGATKIPDLRRMIESGLIAPRLIDYAKDIFQPILLIYGGEDSVNGISSSNLPQNIQEMFNSISSEHKRILVVDGASHALNSLPMKADDCLNQDPKYSFVKDEITNHFGKYLL